MFSTLTVKNVFGISTLAGPQTVRSQLKRDFQTTRLLRQSTRSLPFVLLFLLLQFSSHAIFASPEISTSDDQQTVTVGDAPDQEVYVIGKSVIVNKRAKGVLAVGGDVIVNGSVEGDVATIGGNVIQKENAYIGGDIIVFGGTYKPESANPLREAGKETVMFGVFEEELRNFGKDPTLLFSPTFSLVYIAQRLLLVLFWFVISMLMTTIAPGAVGRAVARLQLSWLKVSALGAGAFLLIAGIIIGGAIVLPDFLSATLGLMGMLSLLLGYVFGRVSIQVCVGKWVQKRFLSDGNRSETLAVFIGVLLWTLFLSLPYIWPIALFSIFAGGIGLILTGRPTLKWQTL